MRKRQSQSGMTLMEMLACISILTLLVTAMGTEMDSAMQIYEDSLFESESAALGEILNTAMADVIRFGRDIREENGEIQLSNQEYGLQNGTLCEVDGYICLKSAGVRQMLVNTGTYGDLRISDFQARYIPPGSGETLTLLDGTRIEAESGGYAYIVYTIWENAHSRRVETVVRPLNMVAG